MNGFGRLLKSSPDSMLRVVLAPQPAATLAGLAPSQVEAMTLPVRDGGFDAARVDTCRNFTAECNEERSGLSLRPSCDPRDDRALPVDAGSLFEGSQGAATDSIERLRLALVSSLGGVQDLDVTAFDARDVLPCWRTAPTGSTTTADACDVAGKGGDGSALATPLANSGDPGCSRDRRSIVDTTPLMCCIHDTIALSWTCIACCWW